MRHPLGAKVWIINIIRGKGDFLQVTEVEIEAYRVNKNGAEYVLIYKDEGSLYMPESSIYANKEDAINFLKTQIEAMGY